VLEGAPVAQPAGRRLERVRHRRAVDLGGDGEQHRLRVSEFGGRVRTEELSGAFQKKQAQDGGYFAAELGGAGSEQRVHFELEEGLLEDARVRLVAVGLAGRLARLVVNLVLIGSAVCNRFKSEQLHAYTRKSNRDHSVTHTQMRQVTTNELTHPPREAHKSFMSAFVCVRVCVLPDLINPVLKSFPN